MAKQVATIQPWRAEFGDRWYKKISSAHWCTPTTDIWSHTGFGPQFLTQQCLARSRQQQLQLICHHAHLPGFQIHAD